MEKVFIGDILDLSISESISLYTSQTRKGGDPMNDQEHSLKAAIRASLYGGFGF